MPPQAPTQQPQSAPAKTIGGAHDPHSDFEGYLRSHGWRPLGNPQWDTCLWEDPEGTTEAYEDKVAKFAWSQDGKKYEQVQAKDGTGAIKPVMQTVYHPVTEPMPTQAAIRVQLMRDRAAAKKAKQSA